MIRVMSYIYGNQYSKCYRHVGPVYFWESMPYLVSRNNQQYQLLIQLYFQKWPSKSFGGQNSRKI